MLKKIVILMLVISAIASAATGAVFYLSDNRKGAAGFPKDFD